jgi:hypothetical protein
MNTMEHQGRRHIICNAAAVGVLLFLLSLSMLTAFLLLFVFFGFAFFGSVSGSSPLLLLSLSVGSVGHHGQGSQKRAI